MTTISRGYRHSIRWIQSHRALLRNSAIATGVFVLALFFTQWWDLTLPAVGRARYQAVFLTNGQTYFGRYYDRIGAYVKIEDVYYLQQVAASGTDQSSTHIVRRGAELHEPSSRMLVPRTAILFVGDVTYSSAIAVFMARDTR